MCDDGIIIDYNKIQHQKSYLCPNKQLIKVLSSNQTMKLLPTIRRQIASIATLYDHQLTPQVYFPWRTNWLSKRALRRFWSQCFATMHQRSLASRWWRCGPRSSWRSCWTQRPCWVPRRHLWPSLCGWNRHPSVGLLRSMVHLPRWNARFERHYRNHQWPDGVLVYHLLVSSRLHYKAPMKRNYILNNRSEIA